MKNSTKPSTKPYFLTACLYAMIAALHLFAAPTQPICAAERPNIIFIFTDDHAPHAIGAYGGPLKQVNPTPNIDKLASEGMLFQNSFCTNSICGPSRAVILTGKHSHVNGFMNNGNRFDGSQPTFPKMLKKAGYQTAMIGKWHLSSDPQGFDFWKVLPGQGDYYNPFFKSAKGREQIQGYCTDIVTNMAINWLDTQRDKKKPFLLMAQHKAPHRCWMPPLRHLALYDDIDIPEPDTLFDKHPTKAPPATFQEMEINRHMHLGYDLFVTPHLDIYDHVNVPAPKATDKSAVRNMSRMTPGQRKKWDAYYEPRNKTFRESKLTGEALVKWKYQRYIKNYLRCVRGADDSVGQIMKYLKDTGLDKNTIVVYSSDQGFYLGDRGWYDKRWMYEESMKMPLIVKWSGVTKPGSVNKDLVQNLDYAETFLEAAGAKIPADMQGKSIVPLLKGESPKSWRDELYYHYYEYPSVHMVPRHYGIRTKRYKLIHYYQFDKWEFFDLQTDPGEKNNLYNNREHAKTIADTKVQLQAIRKRYKDNSDVTVKPKQWQEKFWKSKS